MKKECYTDASGSCFSTVCNLFVLILFDKNDNFKKELLTAAKLRLGKKRKGNQNWPANLHVNTFVLRPSPVEQCVFEIT